MGSFAEVRIGYDKSSGQQVAIKVMKKNKRDTELMRSVECEMNFISKNINHHKIVSTYDVFDTRDNLFIVMEYMPGGMLFDILASEGTFSEKNAVSVMRELLQAIQCLHDNDIVHRDIKPENILALRKTWPIGVKLADFGLADFVLENAFGEKSTCGMYGTPFFVAPEVVRAETYTPAVDMWSLGVLTYNMLSGELPFEGISISDVLKQVRNGQYSFPDKQWAEISVEAKDFVRNLMEIDPKKRLTGRQALAHPWMTSSNISERPIMNDRSALGSDQRKMRMSSMAIDDVAGLLRLEDEDSDRTDHGLRAFSRLFPGKGGKTVKSGKSSRSSGSSRSRNGLHRRTAEKELDNSAAVSNAAPLKLLPDEEGTMSEVSAGSRTYSGRQEMCSWEEGLRPAGRNGREMISGPAMGVEERNGSYERDEGYRGGGLEINNKYGGEEFALPAILSVKDIMRRRQEALNGSNGMNGMNGMVVETSRRKGGESDSDDEEL